MRLFIDFVVVFTIIYYRNICYTKISSNKKGLPNIDNPLDDFILK